MRPFFIGLSISLGFSINPLIMAQHASAQIQDRINNFDFQKEDIESLIELLFMSKKITKKEATHALVKLGELSEDEIKHITMDAFQNFKEEEISMLGNTDDDITSFCLDTFNTFSEESENKILKKSKKYQ